MVVYETAEDCSTQSGGTTMAKLTFEIDETDRAAVRQWMGDHNCRAVPDSFGALLTYQFTPCGIGTSVKVICACDATLDLSHVDEW